MSFLLPLLLVGIVVVLIALVVGIYNTLARLRVNIGEAEADIDTFLKQRYDMIPNLVETVKGYAAHESGTLTKLTELRSRAMESKTFTDKAEVENQISETLKTLFAVAENYPDLKANASFLDLQQKLTDLENNIQKSRRYYNGTVREFNTKIVVFPSSIVASMFKFQAYKFFEAEEAEKENVQVKF